MGGLAAAAAGCTAVIGGLLAGGDDADPGAEDRRIPAAAPDTGSAATDRASSTPSSASPSPSASTSDSPSPSPSPSRSSTAPAAPPTPEPPPSSQPAPESSTPTITRSASIAPADPVLREGDEGPEVGELQMRLFYVRLYRGRVDGVFDREVREAVTAFQRRYQVKGDPEGVYGPNTREALEDATDRGRHQ